MYTGDGGRGDRRARNTRDQLFRLTMIMRRANRQRREQFNRARDNRDRNFRIKAMPGCQLDDSTNFRSLENHRATITQRQSTRLIKKKNK